MRRKILVVVVCFILVVASFVYIGRFVNSPPSKTGDKDKPSDLVVNETVDEFGKLVDVDYGGIESQLKEYNMSDFDNDTLSNSYEKILGTDPYNSDTDGDGLRDDKELEWKTDPTIFDTDNDGLCDGLEIYNYSTNATNPDTDSDKLLDGEEVLAGTDPLNDDSDSDDVKDGDEANWAVDTDEDGLINALDSDSDNDGLKDGEELYTYNTDMLLSDTDNDGINDYDEAKNYPTDPLDDDSDDDELLDGFEAYDSLWFNAYDYLASGAFTYTSNDGKLMVSSAADTGFIIRKTVTLEPGIYKIMAHAKVM